MVFHGQHSQETKDQMSERMKQAWIMRKALGGNSGFKGKTHTQKAKDKIGKGNRKNIKPRHRFEGEGRYCTVGPFRRNGVWTDCGMTKRAHRKL